MATNAAGNAASRPRTPGSSKAPPTTTPRTVPTFQNAKSHSPVNQKASLDRSGPTWALATAAVSSLTKWAARA